MEDSELADCRAALQASEARFHSVVDGTPEGIIIQQDGQIVYANPAMASIFGFGSASELIGLDPFAALIHGDTSSFRERTAAAYRGEILQPTGIWRARHRLGRQLWISSNAHLSEWNGKPAVTSFYTDATQRWRAETRLRESEAMYRTALQVARMGAWEADLVAGTRLWTGEGMTLFGLSLEGGRGVVGGEADELVARMHPEDRHLLDALHRMADETDEFPAEYRIVRPGGEVVWLSGRGQVVERTSAGQAHRLINVMVDITQRKHDESQIQYLLKEMSHRTKNLLSVVQAISRRAASVATSFEQFHHDFDLRLASLAANLDLLMRTGWTRTSIELLVREQLLPFVGTSGARVKLAGPEILVSPETAQALGLAIHELSTNAVKYGALSSASGAIEITWRAELGSHGNQVAYVRWAETGGPLVTAPTRTGFGHTVLVEMVTHALGGHAELAFRPEGCVWTVTFPLTR